MHEWHALSKGQVLKELSADPVQGLSHPEATQRLQRCGPNRLDPPRPRSPLLRFLDQMKDPMILVLLAAAALSLISSRGADWIDSVIILVIVVVNACISISQESNAERALAALRQMSAPKARVIRNHQLEQLDTALLVPGDVIRLEAGDQVPADARLLDSVGLKADESAITGESVPVPKAAEDTLPPETPLGDRHNMVIASSVITAGRATAVVTATGMDTEMGKIASLLLGQKDVDTPLQKKMVEISKKLSFLCLGVCAVMFGVGLLQGKNLLSMLLIAVSLAVAAIPEGLPAIVTIVLALGVQRMAGRHAIVKKLPAVETLGCASVICSDKTGTLTRNQMTVTDLWTPTEKGRELALVIGALCSDAVLAADGRCTGDPTETAIVTAAREQGYDKNQLETEFPRIAELPFDSTRKRMTTVHPKPNGGFRVLVKGGADVLLARCTGILRQGVQPLNQAARQQVEQINSQMAGRALRVLGLAYKELDTLPRVGDFDTLEHNLIFVGLVGMIDPPRPEVRPAVEACHRAGIRPVMITGDHKATAVAIAQELGIWQQGDLALTGADLDFLPEELLKQQITRCAVFARVSPEHKLRIVTALRETGQVVAMTGDGVNDAPALKAADIGCAMGQTGTDVAKGAADMILTDDNFSSIVAAVEQGRGIYANIRKSIHYLLSCNIGEIFTIFIATVLDFHQMPLIPVQLLWLNLVTDSLPALALGVEPVEEDVMEQPPRQADASLFSGNFAFQLAWQGVLVGFVTLAAYFLGEYVLSDPGETYQAANTMAFSTLTLCQLFHAFDVRSDSRSIFEIGLLSNRAMNRAFLVGFLLQAAVLLLPPLRAVFSVVPLNPAEWFTVLFLSRLPTGVCEAVKRQVSRRKEQGRRLVRHQPRRFAP